MAGFATIAALDEHSFVYGCLHDVAAAAPAAPPAASGGAVPAKLVEECKKAGEAVAAAKKSGASKDEIAAKVEKLLSLKKQITALDPTHSLAIVDKKKKKAAPEPAGEKKGLSKREQKRLARGEDVKKKKKDKDPNRWAVDPAKAAAKAEKARLKALAKAEAEKADVKAIAPPTPKGDKKILAEQMSRTYNPGDVEAAWQDWWEKSGWYGCDERKALKRPADEKFVMVIPPVWKASSSALQFGVCRGRSEVLLEGRVASMAWNDEDALRRRRRKDNLTHWSMSTQVIPPPNVTGSLHLGHALTAAIEDCLTRWHRMRGDATLYVPGTDHAGIATQSVVEKMLAKQSPPVSRHDLGREKFLEHVWAWKGQYGSRICTQLRRLGSSVDWSRERFTMDERCAKAVTEAFVRFHEAGIMYRASRLVNWSCALKSAISDLEVDHLELNGGELRTVPGHGSTKYQFAMFTEFAYKVIGSDEEVVVATTRLETMLGDVAVAVHPKDPRYKHLHGKKLRHPFFPSRNVEVVTDDILVDMDKGTGCVKVTPAHDPHDYDCGKRHALPFMTIFSLDGRVVKQCTPFSVTGAGDYPVEVFPSWIAGQMRYDARVLVEKKLEELGLLRGKSERPMTLAVCSRSGDIIEPLVQPQWFVDCTGPAKRACDAVRDGSLRIRPKMHERTWFKWLEDIRPWCISRQLWWGHRIPAWFAFRKGESRNNVDVDAERNKERWIVARSEEQALAQAQKLLGTKDVTLERDEDVLDTWFSSGLFPFSVFGWPDDTDEFKAFYPTQLLETGLDILFFWVARMVMMGLQLTDKLPFTDVYLHAMVRDKDGRKMSKSLGNVIDPLEVIDGCPLAQLVDKLKAGNLRASEVKRAEEAFKADFPEGMPRCGTDALRVGLLAYTVQGRDINLDIKRVVGYRSFCNKLWNAVRFMLGTFDDYKASDNLWSTLKPLAGRDKFILSRLRRCVLDVNTCLTEYKFGEAVQAIYHFFLDDLCDVYVELVKPVMYDDDKKGKGRDAAKQCLWACLDAGLRLLHPLCPFVTEELWQRLPRTFAVSSIMVAPYPSPSEVDTFDDQEAERGTALVLETVTGARSLRAQYALANKPAHFHAVFSNDSERASILEGRKDDCSTLMRAASVTIGNDIVPPKGCGQKLVDDKLSVLVDLKGLVDADAEIKKLQKELKTVEPLVAKLEAKIKDARYLAKAPEKQRVQDREKLKAYGDKAAAARAAIKSWEEFKSGGGEEEDDDFWAEDDDDDPAAAKALEEAKAKAMAKLAKKEANQRSLCNLEIKPWEADQDLKALYVRRGVRLNLRRRRGDGVDIVAATPSTRLCSYSPESHTQAKIKATVVKDGLKWSEGLKLVDVAFGVQKIICTAVVNQTLSMDAIIEEITEELFTDEVQSMSMTSMSLL